MFGIKETYEAIVNLLETLESYGDLISKTDIPSLENLIEWNALSDINILLKQKGAVKQSVAREKGNPAAGILGENTLASAFMSNVNAEAKPHYRGLVLVLLVYLNVNKK